MRIFSLLCSIILHVLIFYLFTFQKLTPKINLDQKVTYKINIITLEQSVKKSSKKNQSSITTDKKTPYDTKKKVIPQPIKPLKPKKEQPIVISEKNKNKPTKKKKKVDLEKEREREVKSAFSDILKLSQEEEKSKEILSKEISELNKSVTKEQMLNFGSSKGKMLDDYKKIVEAVIQQHFRYMSINPNLSANIEVLINENGEIVNKKIIRSSGDKFFDNMALKAIEETENIPQPPVKEPMRFIITLGKKE